MAALFCFKYWRFFKSFNKCLQYNNVHLLFKIKRSVNDKRQQKLKFHCATFKKGTVFRSRHYINIEFKAKYIDMKKENLIL